MTPIWVGDYEVNTFLEVMTSIMGSAKLDFEKLTKGFMSFDVKPAPVDNNNCIPQGTALYDTIAGNSVSFDIKICFMKMLRSSPMSNMCSPKR